MPETRENASLTPEQLKQRRLALGLEQKEMAKCLGVSVRTYENWESARKNGFNSQPFVLELALRYIKQNPEYVESVLTNDPTAFERGVII